MRIFRPSSPNMPKSETSSITLEETCDDTMLEIGMPNTRKEESDLDWKRWIITHKSETSSITLEETCGDDAILGIGMPHDTNERQPTPQNTRKEESDLDWKRWILTHKIEIVGVLCVLLAITVVVGSIVQPGSSAIGGNKGPSSVESGTQTTNQPTLPGGDPALSIPQPSPQGKDLIYLSQSPKIPHSRLFLPPMPLFTLLLGTDSPN
jgi:hypothetical protein